MNIPGSPAGFLALDWQRRARFMPGAIGRLEPALEPEELAWLATQPDVESRLVFTERRPDRVAYRFEDGPFSDDKLATLPGSDWTLLVQDVEKHLPEFRALFDHVPFIPGWRIDDLMVSFAAPGGSVGPHRDNYDVFLCQGTGTRNWMLGASDDVVIDDQSPGRALLRPFDAVTRFEAAPGDVLYLPPGLPHWGIAENACMTYSIGMRAPERAELAVAAERVLGLPRPEDDDESYFYADPDLSLDEAEPGRIHPLAARRIREQGLLDASIDNDDLIRVLGAFATDPKAWLQPEPPAAGSINRVLETPQALVVHGMALLAWHDGGECCLVFVNGNSMDVPESHLTAVRECCANRRLSEASARRLAATDIGRSTLAWMLSEGAFDLDQDT